MNTIVTSMSKAYYELCGERWISSFSEHLPNSRLIIYSEDAKYLSRYIKHSVILKDLHNVAGYDAFVEVAKEREALLPEDKKTNYRWQASRFCHKPFAIYDVMEVYGEVYWFDADVELTSTPTINTLRAIYAPSYSISMLQRTNWPHCEGGFIGFNACHMLVDTWMKFYTTKSIFKLQEWHDCMALDVSVALSNTYVNNVSQGLTSKHVWPETVLNTFSRHNKGPGRKAEVYGDSKEATSGVVLSSVCDL